jgi:hypothetical protein
MYFDSLSPSHDEVIAKKEIENIKPVTNTNSKTVKLRAVPDVSNTTDLGTPTAVEIKSSQNVC